MTRRLLFVAALALAALGAASAAASAAPLPPVSGDWVIDPGEVVEVNNTTLAVDGNITLGIGSALHLEFVQLTFMDGGGKRFLLAPETAVVAIADSAIAAARGALLGGGGFYLRVDGQLLMDRCSVSGLSGPTVPNPLEETEGIHITNASSRIANSSILGSAGYAVTVTVFNLAANPTIADNTIGRGGGGVFLGGFFFLRADALVERNSFMLNALPHIAVTGSNPVIRNNSFVGSSAGIVVILGSPSITGNSFVGNALNAVTVTQGGGFLGANTVTGTAIAFAAASSTLTLRDNTVTFSATFLQASASTISSEGNRATGAFSTALLLNGTTFNGFRDAFQSTQGTPVVRAVNASALTLRFSTLDSVGGPGLEIEGGSLWVDDVSVSAGSSALSGRSAALTLRSAALIGGGADPVVDLVGGSLDAHGGSISGGGEGARVEGLAASFNQTNISGNSGYGIRAWGVAPTLGDDEILTYIHDNGEGDLLYEADLDAHVVNSLLADVPGANVTFTAAGGAASLSGVTGPNGHTGSVRVTARRIDSLNNDLRLAPYSVRATFGTGARGVATAALLASEVVTVVLANNSAPTAEASGPPSVLLGALATFEANGSDADGDALTYVWSISDGRALAGRVIHISFNASGPLSVQVTVSDGFAEATATLGVRVLTLAEANQPPRFVSLPVYSASPPAPYAYDIQLEDPDATFPAFLQLVDGPEGMVLRFEGAGDGRLVWDTGRYFARTPVEQFSNVSVALRAFDGFAFAYQNFTVEVHVPPDAAPTIVPLPALTLEPGATRSYFLPESVADADDDDANLSWRIALPEGTAGAIVTLDPTMGWWLIVRAPEAVPTAHSFNITLTVRDPAGREATSTLFVELHASTPPPAPAAEMSWLAPTLAAAALALAAFALLERRRPPPEAAPAPSPPSPVSSPAPPVEAQVPKKE